MVTINTPDDLLRALRENPEWKEAVRREILTEELINLPARFDEFVGEQRRFNEEQRHHNDKVDGSIARLDRSVDRLDRSVDRIRRDIANMRAVHARTETTREAGVIVGDMGYTLIRVLTPDDLSAMAAEGDISDLERGELISFRRGDLVMEVATADGATHYVAMEISYTADQRDTSRAIRNAGLLTRFTGRPAHAAIASIRNVYEIQHFIDSGQVYWHPLPDRDEPAE